MAPGCEKDKSELASVSVFYSGDEMAGKEFLKVPFSQTDIILHGQLFTTYSRSLVYPQMLII